MDKTKAKQKAKPDDVSAHNAELQSQIVAEKESRLRVMADFQNYRRRMETQRVELGNAANKIMLNSFLEVIDDLNRAKQMHADDKDELLKGYELIFAKLKSLASEFGLEEIIIKEGDKFDPAFMEALSSTKTEEKEKDNTVVHVDAKAYKNKAGGEVLRTAKVIIAKYQ